MKLSAIINNYEYIGYGDKRQVLTLFMKFILNENPFLSRRFQKPYEDLMNLEVLKNVQNLAGQKLLQMIPMPLMSS